MNLQQLKHKNARYLKTLRFLMVKACSTELYIEAAAKGCFDGMVILSCHDINAIAQGGADFDGDTSMCMTQPELIETVERACKSALAFLDTHFVKAKDGNITFGDGCPFPGSADMSKYTFKFAKEQYKVSLNSCLCC